MPTITVDARQLRKALEAVAPVVPKRPPLAALECARVEVRGGAIAAAATNLEVTARVAVPNAADGEGVFLLPLRGALKLLPKLGVVELTPDRREVRFAFSGVEAALQTLPLEDFPALGHLTAPAEPFATVAAVRLREALEAVYAARVLPGKGYYPLAEKVCLDPTRDGTCLRVVASNSTRLAWREAGLRGGRWPERVVIPTGAACLLQKLLKPLPPGLLLYFSRASSPRRDLLVRDAAGEVAVAVASLDDGYVDYELRLLAPYLSTENAVAVVEVARPGELAPVFREAGKLATDRDRTVKLTVREDDVEFEVAADTGRLCRRLPLRVLKAPEEPLEVGVDARYMAEALAHVPPEELVTVGFHGPLLPIVFRPHSDGSFALVLPCRFQ